MTATDILGNACANSPSTLDGSTIDIDPDQNNNPACQINIQ